MVRGIGVRAAEDDHEELLCEAVERDDAAGALHALGMGADPLARTPIRHPRRRDYIEDAGPWFCAAIFDSLNVINALIAWGFPVGSVCHRGETALHYSARWKQEEVMKALLAAGADANAHNQDLDTPVKCLRVNKRGQGRAVKHLRRLLVDAGAI